MLCALSFSQTRSVIHGHIALLQLQALLFFFCRDILLTRLRSRTELHSFRIAALDLLIVSVQTQPGLLELFLDLEPVDKSKLEEVTCYEL